MKPSILFLLVLFVVGCATTKETAELTPPTIIAQTPLPPLPPQHPLIKSISVAIHIDSVGNVEAVRFLKGSLNAEWDSLTIERIKEWKFAPAMYGGKPVTLWYRYQFLLEYNEPKIFMLAEIQCGSKQIADSLYTLLKSGEDFFRLAEQNSIAPSRANKGVVGEINIYRYPKDVWSEIAKLKPGEITPPLPYGRIYAIFKRLPDSTL